MPDIGEMIDGALAPVPRPFGPNARFGYPLRGGFQALMNGFLPLLSGRLELNTRIARVSARRHVVYDQRGTAFPYKVLISTMPLPVLIRLLESDAPATVRRAARELRHVSVRCVHLGIGRPELTEKHWIYYPEDTVFHRIFVQGNASPHCNPPGGFGLSCEITYSPRKPLPVDGQALIERCLADCRRVGLIRQDDPVWTALQVDLPHAYVVYDHGRAEQVGTIRAWLEQQDILLAGRYAEWESYNSDLAFLAGRKAAETAAAMQSRFEPDRAAG
jgi:UDP-galactopyranose mutase